MPRGRHHPSVPLRRCRTAHQTRPEGRGRNAAGNPLLAMPAVLKPTHAARIAHDWRQRPLPRPPGGARAGRCRLAAAGKVAAMESFDGRQHRELRTALPLGERRPGRDTEPLEQRLDRWMQAGRQLVDGVSGGRPGSRSPSRRVEARPGGRRGLDGLGRWVEDRLDWLIDDSDDWREPWQEGETGPRPTAGARAPGASAPGATASSAIAPRDPGPGTGSTTAAWAPGPGAPVLGPPVLSAPGPGSAGPGATAPRAPVPGTPVPRATASRATAARTSVPGATAVGSTASRPPASRAALVVGAGGPGAGGAAAVAAAIRRRPLEARSRRGSSGPGSAAALASMPSPPATDAAPPGTAGRQSPDPAALHHDHDWPDQESFVVQRWRRPSAPLSGQEAGSAAASVPDAPSARPLPRSSRRR